MKNLLLDAILFALFVAELSFHHLPKILHEILGVTMAAAIILHVAINFRRFKSLFKKISPRKIFSVTINFALIICAAIIFFTSVPMSNYLFPDLATSELRRNMTIHQLHTAAPYVMMILIGAHVGLHWEELRQRFFKRFVSENFLKAAAIILSAVGLVGLSLNRFLDRILMKHIFATPATDLIAPLFMLLIVGGVIFFATITFLIDKKIFGRRP
ncbi:MAG: DUF4405 domain-containing protein [Selenomonadaceae bacterium]|nr:DUF4405 domain-containing protein [Selenomonadaceae bacterium]